MSKQRRDAVSQVAESLLATETAIDSALSTTAEFVGMMPVARQTARLSAVVGQDAMDQAMQALMALNEARRAIVAAHKALADVHEQIGMGPVAFGALGKKPDASNGFPLRAVHSVAA